MARSPSVLFPGGETVGRPAEPAFFGDLNLGQAVSAVTAGRAEYDLGLFFSAPLHEAPAVEYRHEVFRDLQRDDVREVVEEFAERMRRMRERLALAGKIHYPRQKQRWFLDAVDVYCGAVAALREGLDRVEIRSRGLRSIHEHVAGYLAAQPFHALLADTRDLQEQLARIKYRVHVQGARVKVSRFDDDADYSSEVEKTFAKFKQGAVKDYFVRFSEPPEMNHIEAQVLDCAARLYPGAFRALADYCERHRDYLAAAIGRFDREVQFYLAYLAHIRRLSATGLRFCYPEISATSHDIYAEDAFDLALATKLVPDSPLVCNDFRLSGAERVLVVTGPNQGGKTTFARMFGQLAHLAALGCPVPAARARLFLPDRVFTHFEREENPITLRGKLDDELVRIRDILRDATSDSVLVLNESFASTTLHDARFIGTDVLRRIIDLGALTVYVTFVDDLASLGEATVSMVGGVVPDDPAERTYRLERRAADGLAYAAAIAEKYGLAYDTLRRRIGR
ncbi:MULTISPECIES: MutS-related protein [Amycolatopsis]|uniref:DNA mismatch repair protein MutS n=1 Tax=Amycolatopsis echigonensis TaxID=2576905 RepID=A0A2N3WLI3_9PSEU|nr:MULTISPECIES: DNA mismatch repair protein MutS [Amycolatopsis]MBB2500805.1 DNA mismatch repair protein MutS [Amycolatopsis echigonensis]MCG3751238.1 DNA mismatch repair protein MutS [Amycolatopsis sp. Poz14]PKV94702.1 MutS-like protein [Amycolatopsis niigatensis]